MAKNLENIAGEDREYLTVLKAGILAFVNTPSPQVAVEFARRVVPEDLRPSFLELEALIKKVKK
jgi:chemotaxis protein MotA